MRFLFFALLLLALFSANPQSLEKNRTLRTYTNHDAYAVYAALLPGSWSYGKPRPGNLVILQETTDERSSGCFPDLKGDWAPVLDSYKSENRASRLLSHSIHAETPYDFMTSKEMAEMFSSHTSPVEGWSKFYKRYPNSPGIIEFSAVGFNRKRTKALVYVVRQCGGLCGTGGYKFLVKRDDEWVNIDIHVRNCGWIS